MVTAWVEKRMARSRWNKLWLVLLVLWSVEWFGRIWHAWSIASSPSVRANGLAFAVVNAVASSVITELFVIWLAGAAVLCAAAYATRPARMLVPVETGLPPPLPVDANPRPRLGGWVSARMPANGSAAHDFASLGIVIVIVALLGLILFLSTLVS